MIWQQCSNTAVCNKKYIKDENNTAHKYGFCSIQCFSQCKDNDPRAKQKNERHSQHFNSGINEDLETILRMWRERMYNETGRHKTPDHIEKVTIELGSVTISKELLKRIIILCHPDKHAGSELSNKVTIELLKLRK